MIGKLQGFVDYIGDGFIILMVSGVGYKVYTPEIFALKDNISLWIETVVREDSIRLFGFSNIAGQNLFNMLTGVSGVGPKVAMAIMGTIKTDTLLTAIATGDAKTIATAPGVGKKVAEKIIVELKSKVGGVSFSTSFDKEMAGTLPDLLSADVAKLIPMALKEISGNK